ncbi:MAG: hypothetical protein QOG15_1108 [Solirubrobacteraceae bacterium]|nr:hypothetical protein [Solirubrobacteraceae bacterium]
MESSSPAHVLVVIHHTGVTAALLEAVRGRVEQGHAWFHVLAPDPTPPHWRAGSAEHRASVAAAERALDDDVDTLEAAARHPTDGSVSVRRDPMDAIEEALYDGDFDEIILSTRRADVLARMHMDLPRRVAHLGLPVTAVLAAPEPSRPPARTRRRLIAH